MNEHFFTNLQDTIDSSGSNDYSRFNDLEMMYLFVHHRKNLKADDERMDNTKKEMIRDLLIFYKQIIEHQKQFELNSSSMDVYSLMKGLNQRNIRKYEDWIESAPLGKGGKPYAKATLARKTVIIKGFFSFLFNEGYIAVPLHQKMKSSNVKDRDRPDRDLHSAEVEAILSHYQDHPILYGLITVLATTGLRIQELCTARVCDLSYYQGEYWLQVEGKGRKKREVLIHEPVFHALVRFRQQRGLEMKIDAADTTPLFVTSTLKAYGFKYLSNYLTKKMNVVPNDIIQKRATPISPHSLRHFFAIQSAELDVDILRIMQSLGHSSTRTTLIYLEKTLARKNHASHAWSESPFIKNIK